MKITLIPVVFLSDILKSINLPEDAEITFNQFSFGDCNYSLVSVARFIDALDFEDDVTSEQADFIRKSIPFCDVVGRAVYVDLEN